MSSGVAVDFSALSKAGTSLAAGLEESRKQTLLQVLGGQVQSGDYAGAAKTAFDAGDLQTGLSLVKLGDAKAQSAAFQKEFSGGMGALFGAPATVDPAAQAAPVRAPSFGDTSGPAGGYLATLRGKESGGNASAQNPNSTATGIDQFTAGTWAGLAKKYPDLRLTPNGRTDPEQSTRAMERFTRDNANALTSAGVPVTPGNLYVSHFLGEAGGPRFVRGAMSSPDAPATQFVTPGAAAANRTVFYNRDGSPKTAGAVYAERTSRFGGGGGGAAPAGRVQVASADASFVPRMPGAAPPIVDSTQPGFQVTGGPDPLAGFVPSTGINGDGKSSGPTMTLPAAEDPVPVEQRVQIAQAAPQQFVQAGLNPRAAAQLQATPVGSAARIQMMVRFISHPGAPEGAKEALKPMLANELQMDRENRQMTSEQKDYNWDVANGYKGDPMAWRASKAAATRAPEKDGTEKVAAARQNWRALGLPDPAAPENATFWKDFGSRALGGGALVNVDNRGADHEKNKLSDIRLSDAKEMRDAGRAAGQTLVDVTSLRDLSRQIGPVGAEGSVKLALAPYAQAVGVPIEGLSALQAHQAIIKRMIPAMRTPGSGTTSDKDLATFEAAAPGMLMEPKAREMVMDIMQAQATGAEQRGRIASLHLAGKLSADRYQEELDKIPNPLDMFRKFRAENPTAIDDAIKNGGGGRPGAPAGQRDASVKLKAAPADEIAFARAAIAAGTPQAKVLDKMRARGFDPSGL